MTNHPHSSTNERLDLKEPTGWFAAGDAFRQALVLLSDGAFRLFAHICLEADRRTGRFRATHRELAAALSKSKRAIGSYVAELENTGVCSVQPGRNQFSTTVFEITDSYWPYHRTDRCSESAEQMAYVESVRRFFLALGCGSGKFGAAEAAAAINMHRRGIPLTVIEQAMLMGACRKYTSWLQGRALEPIRSLSFFEPLIAEVQEKPLPPGYSAYLSNKLKQLGEAWIESMESGDEARKGGYPDMPLPEIVQ
jgi:hypothetical protein